MADRLHRQSSFASRRTLERRPSATSSLRSSQHDVFSDHYNIYDADDLMVPADGFQPADGFRPSSSSSSTTPTPRPQTLSRNSTRRHPPPPRPSEESKPPLRSSIAKNGLGGGAPRNEFALRHDADEAPRRMASTRTEMSQRPNSMISMFSLPPAQSPYIGASGPSHPYGMYPQDTSLNRSSTVSSSYAGPQRPTHPYGMYPQTTSTESDLAETDIATVGFPGLARPYARRLGPDGEDADDIIGPDGHTEQLPPYTRYPDGDGSDKERYAPIGTASISGRSIRTSTIEETTSIQQATSPRERLLATDDSEANPEADTPEGRRPKWARRGKRRFFGGRVPAWFVCAGMFILIALAATVGGVIGHHMGLKQFPHGGPHDKGVDPNATAVPDNFPTSFPTSVISITTTLIDARPAATHGALPSLPAGQFSFDLQAPSEASSNCVTNPGQSGADVWACTDDGQMTFGVKHYDTHGTRVYLSGQPDHGITKYGPQPPTMPGPLGVALMMDVEQLSRGPAFFFQSAYTKQVYVQEQTLNSSMPKRSVVDAIARSLHRRDDFMKPGDNPWVCNWNNTLLEGFIYVQESGSNSTNSSPTAASSTTAPSTTGSAPPTPTQPAPLMERDHHDGHGGRGGGGKFRFFEDQATVPYPFPMKFEERRTPANPIKPYCQQMTVNDDMSMAPKLNNGQPITITIDETDPQVQEHTETTGVPVLQGPPLGVPPPHRARTKRATDPQACLCQWMT